MRENQVRTYTYDARSWDWVPLRDVKALGVPFENYADYDVIFILKESRIPRTKSRRKGRWQLSDDGKGIYYVCPWCSSINQTDEFETRRGEPSSLFCQRKTCRLHLFIKWSRRKKK